LRLWYVNAQRYAEPGGVEPGAATVVVIFEVESTSGTTWSARTQSGTSHKYDEPGAVLRTSWNRRSRPAWSKPVVGTWP
jgi:hypothetical protein